MTKLEELNKEEDDDARWAKIEKEWTALDLLNLSQCFVWSPERKKWLYDLFEKRLKEEELEIEEKRQRAIREPIDQEGA